MASHASASLGADRALYEVGLGERAHLAACSFVQRHRVPPCPHGFIRHLCLEHLDLIGVETRSEAMVVNVHISAGDSFMVVIWYGTN